MFAVTNDQESSDMQPYNSVDGSEGKNDTPTKNGKIKPSSSNLSLVGLKANSSSIILPGGGQ